MNRMIFRTIALIAVGSALAGVALAQGGNLPNNPQPSLTVNVAAARHAISPDIYGVNDYSENTSFWGSGSTALPITLQNWGGDATETYNYLIDDDNAGADNSFISSANATPTVSKQVDTWTSFMEAKGYKSSITVPIIGMVDNNNRETWCSYPESLYPGQGAYSGTKDAGTNSPCGNGQVGGVSIKDTNPTLVNPAGYPPNYVAETPSWWAGWYDHMLTKYGPSFNAGGTVTPGNNSGIIWIFDNEPEYWNYEHGDIIYATTGSGGGGSGLPGWEFLANGPLVYGAAAKAADSTALTGGPTISSVWPLWDPDVVGNDGVVAPFGNNNPSAATCAASGSNPAGPCPFYQYYLTSAANYQAATGIRPLDYFIVHYYPDSIGGNWSLGGPQCPNLAGDCQGNSPPSGEMWGIPPADGVYYTAAAASGSLIQPSVTEGDGSADGGISGEAARLRCTRALWDPTYVTEDWEGYYFSGTYGVPAIIRNMKSWINQYYPGTKTGITEYNWGGGSAATSTSAPLAYADIFGIFGREGLDMATLWGPPTSSTTNAVGTVFKMFLNYNGTVNGTGHFGDVSVSSTSTVAANSILPGTNSTDGEYVLAIYGAQRSLDNALTMVVVNKSIVLSVYPYSTSAAKAFTAPLTIQNFTPSSNTVTAYQILSGSDRTLSSAAAGTLTEVPGVGGALPTYTMNYTFPANSVTLLVVPGAATQAQAISFTAPTSPVTYGVAPITLSATGGASGNPVTFSIVSGPGTLSGANNSILTVTGAGTIVVAANQAGTSGALNYSAAAQVTQSIVVNKAPLTVTANNASMAVGAALPAFTATYSGFVNGDGAGVVSGSPSFTTTATSSSPAGTYPITPALGTLTAANYSFTTFVNGTLSIVQAPAAAITTSAVLSGSHSGGYTAVITVTNSGAGAANNLTLTTALLGGVSGTPLPQGPVSIPAGGFTTFTVSFAGSAGADGAGVAEKYSGTYTGGSFSASVRSVTLP
jgi:hypothetical protein